MDDPKPFYRTPVSLYKPWKIQGLRVGCGLVEPAEKPRTNAWYRLRLGRDFWLLGLQRDLPTPPIPLSVRLHLTWASIFIFWGAEDQNLAGKFSSGFVCEAAAAVEFYTYTLHAGREYVGGGTR